MVDFCSFFPLSHSLFKVLAYTHAHTHTCTNRIIVGFGQEPQGLLLEDSYTIRTEVQEANWEQRQDVTIDTHLHTQLFTLNCHTS